MSSRRSVRVPGSPLRSAGVAASPHRFTAVAALLIGLAAPFQLQWIGILYASEALLAVVAGWALLANVANPRFWRRPFTTLLVFLAVTTLAYIAADLILATDVPNLARGWARNIFLGANFIGLYFLCRRNPSCLLVYVAAAAASTIAYLSLRGPLLENWKFGAATPVTLLAASLIPLIPRRGVWLGPLMLAALGCLHVALDSREIGGNCLLAGALLFARSCSALRWKSLSWLALASVACAATGILVYTYALTGVEYGPRRQLSEAWRAASLVTAVSAISASPWIGNGSQANTFDLQSRYDAVFAERSGVRYRGQPTDTSTFSPHSELLQAWCEAGVFAMAVFLYLGWKLARAIPWCVFRRPLDVFSLLFALCLLRASWHLLFSPFAGLARLDLALAAVMVCLLDFERRSALAQ